MLTSTPYKSSYYLLIFCNYIVRFYLPNHTSIFRFELCLRCIHIHLKPGILAEKNLELLLKPTTAKYVQDRSTNSTICWFTKEIIAKMKTKPFSIVMFVAKLSKKWITWKITGKCFSKWSHNFLKIYFEHLQHII